MFAVEEIKGCLSIEEKALFKDKELDVVLSILESTAEQFLDSYFEDKCGNIDITDL